MRRYSYNKLLLTILEEYLTSYPNVRFSQALSNLGFISDKRDPKTNAIIYWIQEYNLESKFLLDRVMATLDEME